jgi:NAD(P)-dependent dehydrogenase (short-subunit alcohol dehydrogenase family)
MTKILVTGSSDGIGREVALQLAREDAQVIVHGRTEQRAVDAARGVAGAEVWVCDFASLEEVRSSAARLPRGIDVLINNAGVYLQQRQVTRDGYEATFQINHLAPFLLTRLLLPSMSEGSRIVNVSSAVHSGAEIAWDDLMSERRYSAYGAYGQSKLANLLFTRELARRQTKAAVNALHPGVIGTKLLRGGFGGMGGRSAAQGAETPVYLALSKEVEGVTGKYFVNCRETRPSPEALDDEAAQRLWDVSERLTNPNARSS